MYLISSVCASVRHLLPEEKILERNVVQGDMGLMLSNHFSVAVKS